jgi:hypothetical protein
VPYPLTLATDGNESRFARYGRSRVRRVEWQDGRRKSVTDRPGAGIERAEMPSGKQSLAECDNLEPMMNPEASP